MDCFPRFKLYDYKTPHQAIVEHKVGKEFIIFKKQSFLAGNKCKAIAKFKQKLLKMVYQRIFEI